jgi:hypothetical protein
VTEPGPEATQPSADSVAGEAYGVPILLSADSPEVLARVQELLPPGWKHRGVAPDPDTPVATAPHFSLRSDGEGGYVLHRDGLELARTRLDVALHALDAQVRAFIALHSPDRIFVHAGVVGVHGRAIVIPGPSFSGKTTFVAELVRAGAIYYSDEYAVLDDQGLVHPYAKRLSIRTNPYTATQHDVRELGGSAGDEPLPLGLIVVAQYRAGGRWEPKTLSPGDAVLALLANTVPARERPEQTMNALRRAVNRPGVLALEGERGEASLVVQGLLQRVSE